MKIFNSELPSKQAEGEKKIKIVIGSGQIKPGTTQLSAA